MQQDIQPVLHQILTALNNIQEKLNLSETKPIKEDFPHEEEKLYRDVYESIHDNDWTHATTQEVSIVRTEYHDWKPLRRYCVNNQLKILKRNINGLRLNAYPAEAWKEVYGITLGDFDV